ncbi:hypothetical protein BO71DRAFT_427454 [Aspergillus ellipticus CBS 707.79]|uniref:Uncharacterized protein n=1 Tax=Aspergillus ellipticus CBS 707.79 TaxID=1448320 RepID=A0A319DHS0_9EURO|nr:hypothetical protein BO71DRAFT_427454 [Aspergillus ellipticus CBS 707.79]
MKTSNDPVIASVDDNGRHDVGEVIELKASTPIFMICQPAAHLDKPFSRFTIFSVTVVLMATWEALSRWSPAYKFRMPRLGD